MLYREVFRVLGSYLFILALVLLAPLCVSIYYRFAASPYLHPQPHVVWAFVATIAITVVIGLFFRYVLGAKSRGQVFRREALLVVACIWFLTAIIGGLPFYLSGTLDNPVNAYFETMSGLTTTGASVMQAKKYDPVTGKEIPITKVISEKPYIEYSFYGTITPVRDSETGKELYTGVEAVSKGLLFWRSMTQWLGGMGIVVLFVAILPILGVGGKALYQAEVPGPTNEAITPRIKETAGLLWKIYLGITILEIVLLMVTNSEMSLFDATCVTFSTISTGGFSVHNASIAGYHNHATEWIVLVFMIVGSVNFALYFYCLKGKIYRLYQPEFLIYIASLVIFSSIIIRNIEGTTVQLLTGETVRTGLADAVRIGAFQLVSAQTSTGFTTANYNIWPFMSQALMLITMFIGAMAGSTAGGIKIVRHYMLFRIASFKIESLFKPEAVRHFRISQKIVDKDIAITLLVYFVLVVAFTTLGTFLYIAIDGIDLETAFSVMTCNINNIGMAFRMAGPTESFAFLSNTGKLFSTLWMVLGRLELLPLLIVFIPSFWRKV
ncbi:TrkH family potassium uptake protein [Simkania negevensis]|uniref:TrkH family potassium uptake protein n=1 Tax=Simkania negevensis TaxID=83561 RepID=A0ABS3AQD6_9BACT|nr:TrkH family potassium uptake protein [Simkania negevensis]